MDETSKTRKLWGPLELSILGGTGIDIGCGSDPVTPTAERFDREHGDANHASRYIRNQFDFVYSSHCLEHMLDPRATLLDWWSLVRPGGHLFLIVPDEDLYEQGVWPSRFNPEHHATFTISKQNSWSPVSRNLRELAESLPESEIISLQLQDNGYDRRLLRHGPNARVGYVRRFAFRGYAAWRRRRFPRSWTFEYWQTRTSAVDQTLNDDVVAQIQCIVRKDLVR